jgi:hypothetical protein
MNDQDDFRPQLNGTQVPKTTERIGSIGRGFLYIICILVLGFVNGVFSRWLLGYFPLAVLIGFGPLIYVLVEAIIVAFIVRMLAMRIWPQLKISKVYLWIAVVVFAVLQLYMIFFVPDANFNILSYTGESTAHSQITLDSTNPVVVDSRGLELNGIHVEGNQVIWSAHSTNPRVDDLSLFSADLSSMTGKSLTVANLSQAQGQLDSRDTGGEDTVVNGQIYYIDDGVLYHYDPQSAKSTLLENGIVMIYGFDSTSNLLILGSGSVVPGNFENVTQGDGIPDTFYNVASGAKGDIPFPSSTLDMTKVITENKPPFVQGSYIYYLNQFSQIARYDMRSDTSEALSIVPERDIWEKYGSVGAVSPIAANDRYLAYYYWPADTNTYGRTDYAAVGIYDLDQKKIVFDKDISGSTSGVVGKFLGNDFYYSQELLGSNSITIHDINLSSMQDTVLLSLQNIVGGITTSGWDIGDGYIVYAQRQPSTTTDDFSGRLYFQKIATQDE